MLINNKSLIKTINKLNLTDDEREKFNKISEDDRGNFVYNGKPIISGATPEQVQQLQTAYTHSQSKHVTMDEVNNSGFIKADYVGNKQIVYLTQAQFNALPTKSPECMYVVTDEEDSSSDGTTINLTNYYTKSETNSTFATKTELNSLKLQLDGNILSFYSGTSLLSSVDLSSLSSSGGSTPVEVYGNIVPSLTTVSIAEGNETTVGITLDNAPTSEQTVNVSVNNSNCTVSPETLTFTSDNYSTSQNITIRGAHLSNVYTDQASIITLICSHVINNYPDATFIIATPLHCNLNEFTNPNSKNSLGLTLLDYCEAIKNICVYYNIPCFDLHSVSGYIPHIEWNKTKYTSDGLHPNENGKHLITKLWADFIDNLAE